MRGNIPFANTTYTLEIKDNKSIFTIGTTHITCVMGREMRWGGGGYGRRGGGLSGPCGQQSAASEVRTPAPPPRICRYPSQSVETHHVYNQYRSFRIILDTMDLPDIPDTIPDFPKLFYLVKSSDESSEILSTWYRCRYMICPVKED